ncbi:MULTISPECIES: hypothetical protein [Prosthecochloris]|uniref:Uncharacterized protein n=1 Tax=Prosthecochloris marina TaxID=2017681 RepID=A0A317T839_9CHLB|nr:MULTISPECIES: hypothetical protein [Prosthecochloris]PWW82854.1 hypothetical protein CR164_03705 [Prosthecochloris marina]UZJ37856.1 hypothetical protein OO005_01250 [Prosthecochloris sp. SCSIO W1103]
MAKEANNNKPRVKIKFLNLLLVILGADIILLFAPGIGMLNAFLSLDAFFSWGALVVGIILLVLGFKDLYQKQ